MKNFSFYLIHRRPIPHRLNVAILALVLAGCAFISHSAGAADEVVIEDGSSEIISPDYEMVGWNWDGGFPFAVALKPSDVDADGPLAPEGGRYLVGTLYDNFSTGIFTKKCDVSLMDFQTGRLSLKIRMEARTQNAKSITFALMENANSSTLVKLNIPSLFPNPADHEWHRLEIPLVDGKFSATGATFDGEPVQLETETSDTFSGSFAQGFRWVFLKEDLVGNLSISIGEVQLLNKSKAD